MKLWDVLDDVVHGESVKWVIQGLATKSCVLSASSDGA